MPRPPSYGSPDFEARYRRAVYSSSQSGSEPGSAGYVGDSSSSDVDHSFNPWATPSQIAAQHDRQRSDRSVRSEPYEPFNWSALGSAQDLARRAYDYEPSESGYLSEGGQYRRRKSDDQRIADNWVTRAGYSVPNLPGVESSSYLSGDKYDRKTDRVSVRDDLESLISSPSVQYIKKPAPVPAFRKDYGSGPVVPQPKIKESAAPSASRVYAAIPKPKVKQEESGCVTFTNTEYIQTVTTVTSTATNNNGFNLIQISCNPALYSAFPTLSQVASSFEYYRWKSLKFKYVSLCSDTQVSTASNQGLGSVCMVDHPNPCVAAPVSTTQMANWPGAKLFKPSISVEYKVDCTDQRVSWYFTRTNPTYSNNLSAASVGFPVSSWTSVFGSNSSDTEGNPPPFQGDPSAYDYCNFYLATFNYIFSAQIGEIWCEYEVELTHPYLNSSILGNQCLYYRAEIGDYEGTAGGSSSSGLAPSMVQGHGNMACMVYSSAATGALSISFPPYISTGVFRIDLKVPVKYATGTIWGSSMTGTPNLTFPPILAGCQVVAPVCMNGSGAIPNPGSDCSYHYDMGSTDPDPYVSSYITIIGSGSEWYSAVTLAFYVQITAASASINFTTVTSDFPAIYQGCITISQQHPNLALAWSNPQVGLLI